MLKIKSILLPVDFPNASLRVIHEAAALAHQFGSEIVLMHVVTPRSHAAGVPDDGPEFARWDILAEILRDARKNMDQTLALELDGLTIRRVMAKGDPTEAIVETAQREKADLIMMPSHGYTFNQFLQGSVTPKVLNGTECPVWTGAHVEESPARKFAIRNVLCAVNFDPHDTNTASWAAQLSEEFSARLTFAHVTAGVEFWGPGGGYINRGWKDSLVSDASQQIEKLRRSLDIKAEVFIGSGDVPKVLSQAAKQTNADLLVTGCYPYGGHLRTHGYAIICAVPIPILNV